jgi:hypothetical protein
MKSKEFVSSFLEFFLIYSKNLFNNGRLALRFSKYFIQFQTNGRQHLQVSQVQLAQQLLSPFCAKENFTLAIAATPGSFLAAQIPAVFNVNGLHKH